MGDVRFMVPVIVLTALISAAAGAVGTLSVSGSNAPGAMLARQGSALPPDAAVTADAAPARGAEVTGHKEADGLFHVSALVNGHATRFVVDTGANVMVLNAGDAASAGVIAGGATSVVTTANGDTTMRWARVDNVAIAGRTVRDVPVAIAPGNGVSLIGLNVLSHLGGVQITGDRMVLR